MWDSHPLSLAATPQQVFIDSILQLQAPEVSVKLSAFRSPPNTPDFDKEASDVFVYEGLPPLGPRSIQRAIFTNVSNLFVRSRDGISVQERPENVIVHDGKLVCLGACSRYLNNDKHAEIINLDGGSIVPGLAEIRLEPSTTDVIVFNPLVGSSPAVLGGSIRAINLEVETCYESAL